MLKYKVTYILLSINCITRPGKKIWRYIYRYMHICIYLAKLCSTTSWLQRLSKILQLFSHMEYGITLLSLWTALPLIFISEAHSSWIHLYMNHVSKDTYYPFTDHADHSITCQQAISQSLLIYQVKRCPMANRSPHFMQLPCHDSPLSGEAVASPGESSFKKLIYQQVWNIWNEPEKIALVQS